MSSFKSLISLNKFDRLKFLTKDSFLYGFALAVHKIFAIITIPILTRYFSIEEYGMIDLYTVVSGLLVTMFVFGQDSAVARFFYDNEDDDLRKQMISESFVFQLAVLLLFLPIIWIYSEDISNAIYKSTHSNQIFQLIILQIPFMLLVNFSQNLLKWTFNRTGFLIISLGLVVVNMTLLILGILLFDINVEGVFFISLMTYTVFGLLGLFFIRHWFVFPKKMDSINKVVVFAIPFGIASTLEVLIPAITRWSVGDILGPESLGIFAVGARLASVMSLYISAFQTAWGPFSLSIYKQYNAIDTYNLALKLFSWMIGLIVLLLSFASDELVGLISTDSYKYSSVIFFPLAAGISIQAIGSITTIGISISKKSYLIVYGYLLFILFILISFYIFTPIFGIYSVAIILMFGYIIKSFISSWLAQSVHRMDWEYTNIVLLVISILMLGFFGEWTKDLVSVYVNYIVNFLIIFSYFVIGWGVLCNESEKKEIKKWLFSKP